MKIASIIFIVFLLFGCNDKKEAKKESAGMKCGAGKCGASMFDTNKALAKKKKNILSQISKEDKRKDCVLKAKTTKEVYDCVRNPKTKRLSIKCGSTTKEAMKCGAGKCGGGM